MIFPQTEMDQFTDINDISTAPLNTSPSSGTYISIVGSRLYPSNALLVKYHVDDEPIWCPIDEMRQKYPELVRMYLDELSKSINILERSSIFLASSISTYSPHIKEYRESALRRYREKRAKRLATRSHSSVLYEQRSKRARSRIRVGGRFITNEKASKLAYRRKTLWFERT